MASLLFEEVSKAAERIASHIHRTPVYTSATIDSMCGRNVYFKCENLQKTGSFKVRGSLNAILKLKEGETNVKGIVTHSSGNHGQAIAWASNIGGLPCSVVVPNNTPKIKCDAIRGYGANLVFCEPSPQARVSTCQKIADKTDYAIVPPYDHYDVIAGQGTIGKEFLEQTPQLDAIIVPISGGGMTSGISIAVKAMKPECKVFAVEPKGKNLEPCLKSGKRLWSDPPQFVDTIAEGIRTQQCGHLTFPILVENIEKEVFVASDEEMVKAMKLVFERMKLVIEASSAAGVVAVLSEQMKQMSGDLKNIGVILCGGNVDIDNLPW